MTLALRSPKLLGALIPVDNAPVDATLKSDFHRYVQGMREIEQKGVKKQVEADAILKNYEEVSQYVRILFIDDTESSRHYQYGSFYSLISFGLQMENISVSAFRLEYLLRV